MRNCPMMRRAGQLALAVRSEEHTSELQSLRHLVCRLLLEKKKDFPHLNETGINESSGNSTITRHFMNHESAWLHIAHLRAEKECNGICLFECLYIVLSFCE